VVADYTLDCVPVIVYKEDDGLRRSVSSSRGPGKSPEKNHLPQTARHAFPRRRGGAQVLRRIADRSEKGLANEGRSLRHEHLRGAEEGDTCFSNDDGLFLIKWLMRFEKRLMVSCFGASAGNAQLAYARSHCWRFGYP